MDDFDSKIVENPPKENLNNWLVALGLQCVDNLTPSLFLEILINKNLKGEIDNNKLDKILAKYYEVQHPENNIDLHKKMECDIVSNRIVQLLNNDSFICSPEYLNFIHKYLFANIYDFAGEFRCVNLTKDEIILNGKSVIYADFRAIKTLLTYDFENERLFSYNNISSEKLIKHLSKFVSDIWQIHPFREGNTRTISVFIIKYLRYLGFDINNNLFQKNSVYFRNALVRSNYNDDNNNILPNFEYLAYFFENLLLNQNHDLNIINLEIPVSTKQKK